MKTSWTKGLGEDASNEIKREFLSNAHFRERARLLISEKATAHQKKVLLEAEYENPNWALKQADAVGYNRALQEIISLFE